MTNKRRKSSIRLDSSDEILFFPDESWEERVLCNLLLEAHERGIHPFKKVIVGVKSRDSRFHGDWGPKDAYKETFEPVRLYELIQMWQNLPWVDSGTSFSPGAELERSYWAGEVIRRHSAFPSAIQSVMYSQNLALKKGVRGPFI